MKIVVIGGTGLIGSKTVPILRKGGHEVVAASSKTGVPLGEARLGRIGLDEWVRRSRPRP